MTKHTLYARAALLIGSLLGPYLLVPRAAAGQEPHACAACLAITIQPGQVLLLPEDLQGLTVLVRAASLDWTPELLAAIAAVSARGGRPGVVLEPPPIGDGAEREYRLKLLLADVRGAIPPDAVLAIDASALTWRDLGAIAAYADVALVRRPPAEASNIRVWPIVNPPTLGAGLRATTTGEAERWVLEVPSDVLDARQLVHGLAAAAAPPPDALVETVEVRGAPVLRAAEIVARHQALARRQQRRVRHVVSSGTLTLTFEAPGFPAPIAITSQTTIFQAPGRMELAQRDIRVNGVAFGGRGVPRLPILEPERVASLPLVVTLSHLYRYERLADESIDGIRCYVVSFEPVAAATSLFRGRAWIAMDSFAAVRIASAQTRLRGAIVSSEQVDEFREFEPGVWLLARSEVRQLYEGAGHRTPINRVLSVETAEVNPADFDARLQRAYASADVMLRDTAQGFRYLSRERVLTEGGRDETVIVAEVQDRADRVRTLAAGVILDPNINIPLPFAGLSYVDFNLFGTGAQLNAFFGGSYGQLAFSLPSIAGTRWQLAGRAFGIASSYNDRSFRDGREVYAENVRQRPAHVSAWLLRPLSPRLVLRAGYELDVTMLSPAPETAEDFVVPSDQIAHGLRIAIEGQRSGWTASAWWNAARRDGWRSWGRADQDYRPAHETFQRVGLTAARSTVLGPTLVTRIEASLMGGQDLDRFSRYSFGTFDNRLRGYPSALVRYDRGGVVRSSLAWSASRLLRLDGFFDTALVRDRGFGTGYRNYTGLGAAIEVPLPFGVLASIEWGYGVRGVKADGSLGTHVVRVSGFKMF